MERNDPERTLTLTGEGQVRVKPDVATLSLGVVTNAKSAQEATAMNGALMTRVGERVRALGIPSEDLQTVGFNISPVMDWEQGSPTHGQIVGYRVEDTLAVKCDVAKAGKVLDEGVGAGANVAGGLSFGLRDEGAYRQRALQGAVHGARRDAEVVAGAMGVTLKGVKTAEVMYGGSPVIVRGAVAKSEARTPIEPGTLTLSASVRLVYLY